jgi:hypothetical protein
LRHPHPGVTLKILQPEPVALEPNTRVRIFIDETFGAGDEISSFCVSFVIVQERGMMEALTTDEHFQQAGFQALLKIE